MRKKTIAWLFIPGTILVIVGYVLIGMAAAAALPAIQAATTPEAQQTALASASSPLGLAIAGIGGILYFVSWIGALVATAKQGRWGWFVVVFLLSWLGQLIYLIAGPAVNSVPAQMQQ